MKIKKRKKNRKILVITIISSIVLIGIIVYLFATGVFQSVSGYTTLSISDVEVIDAGQRIRIYGVAMGAEQVNIFLNPTVMNQYIQSDGYSSTKAVTGTITMTDPTREFLIVKDTSKNFFKLNYLTVSLLQSCESNTPPGTISVGRIAMKTCLYYNSLGTYSTFTGQYIDDTPVDINIGGASGTLNPASGTNVLVLNDGQTKIEWVGNLVNYQGLNVPYQYATLFSSSNFDKLIDSGAYSSQQTALNTFTDCIGSQRMSLYQFGLIGLIIALFKSDSAAQNCVNNFNNKITSILVDKTPAYITSTNIDGADFTANGLKVDLRTPVTFPTFIITLDASKVGIIELIGDPSIVSCPNNKEINSGDTYSTSVSVKNIGSQDGSFYAQLSCVGSSSASGVVSEQYVPAGQTANLPVQVSGSNTVSGTQSNTCTIKVIDRKSQNSDSCTFGLNVKYLENIVCSPNSITCKDAQTLKTCNEDGTDFTTKDCEFGCIVLEDGSAQCKGEDNGDIECPFGQEWREEKDKFLGIFPGKPAGCYTAGWVYFVIGITIVIVIIIIFIFVMSLRRGVRRGSYRRYDNRDYGRYNGRYNERGYGRY